MLCSDDSRHDRGDFITLFLLIVNRDAFEHIADGLQAGDYLDGLELADLVFGIGSACSCHDLALHDFHRLVG